MTFPRSSALPDRARPVSDPRRPVSAESQGALPAAARQAAWRAGRPCAVGADAAQPARSASRRLPLRLPFSSCSAHASARVPPAWRRRPRRQRALNGLLPWLSPVHAPARDPPAPYAAFPLYVHSAPETTFSHLALATKEERTRALVYRVREGGFGSSDRHPTFLLMLIVSHMLINAHCITLRILMGELISRCEVGPILSRPHRREHRLGRRPILRVVRTSRGRRPRRSGSCLWVRRRDAGQHQPDRRT